MMVNIPKPLIILDWLKQNGVTPIPCMPLSKKPINEISENGMNYTEGNFHEPTPTRLAKINEIWDNLPVYQEKYSGISIGINCNPGFNQNKILSFIDIDVKNIVPHFVMYFSDCPLIYGKNGVKIIFFLDKHYPAPAGIIECSGKHIGEFYSGVKRLCIVYGKHEKSTPDNNIWYAIKNRNKIPTLKLEQFTELFNACLSAKNCNFVPISASDNSKKQYTKTHGEKNLKGRTLTEFMGWRIEDLVNPFEFREEGGKLKGDNPTHSEQSKSGTVIHINTDKNSWHCQLHDTGGGPLEWFAMNEGIICCQNCNGNALKGKKWFELLDALAKRGHLTHDEYMQYEENRRKG